MPKKSTIVSQKTNTYKKNLIKVDIDKKIYLCMQ